MMHITACVTAVDACFAKSKLVLGSVHLSILFSPKKTPASCNKGRSMYEGFFPSPTVRMYRRARSPFGLFICRMGVCVCMPMGTGKGGPSKHACPTGGGRGGRTTKKANAYARENNRVGVVGSPSSSPLLPNAFCVFLLHQPTSLPPSSFPSTLCSREVGGTFAHGSRKRRRRERGKTRGKKKRSEFPGFFFFLSVDSGGGRLLFGRGDGVPVAEASFLKKDFERILFCTAM